MKPGEKYIIEIDRVVKGPRDIAFIKGFNALAFDQYGLDKLRHAEEIGDAYKRGWDDAMGRFPKSAEERYEIYQRGWNECAKKIENIKDAAYQNGLDDAWNIARALISTYGIAELKEIFDKWGKSVDAKDIIMEYTASESLSKIRAWEKEKSEIHVGDEVVVLNNVDFFVVTNINDQSGGEVLYEGVRRDGRTARAPKSIVAKTGRHFDVSAFVGKEEKE